VVVYTDPHWRRFSEMIGVPDLVAHDPRFASLTVRNRHTLEIGAMLADALAHKTTQAWLDLFNAADIPASRVNSVDDLLTDPHLAAVGFWQEVEHPTEGRVRVTGFPGTWSRTPPTLRRLAPNLGEHNAEVLGTPAQVAR
jgi:crotonobetainyl-CoA:carnitine CoA-transferase CaiB-like acyl-CoA transferase